MGYSFNILCCSSDIHKEYLVRTELYAKCAFKRLMTHVYMSEGRITLYYTVSYVESYIVLRVNSILAC